MGKSTHFVYFVSRGLTLHEALAILEDDADSACRANQITIFPPNNATADFTDEDSGPEDFVLMDKLPASQLQTQAEVAFEIPNNEDGFSSDDSDDDLPLSTLLATCKKKQAKTRIKKQKTINWVKEDLATPEKSFETPKNFSISGNPLELFRKFFDEEVINLILTQTNKYAQQKNLNGNIEKCEIMAFIGILILSGYVKVPRRRIFWELERDAHNDLISEAMTRNRFEFIFANLHVSDNQHLDNTDKFTKVRGLFSLLNKKFIEHAPLEEMHSIDEAMVPYYGRHGCKQYIHGKPIRYGYKLWVGTTRLGYINWFEPYQGASTNISAEFADLGVGAGVVLEYAKALRTKWPNLKLHLFFDNFFSSIALIEKLTELNFHATGTIRENRLKGISLMNTKDMKKGPRGSYDYAKISDQNIIAVKWHDNNVVSLISNVAGVAPIHTVKRYSQKEKKNIQVEQPHLIKMYNDNMGGVDRSDQNISLYRVSIRGKKWYIPLLTHCIDMAMQNAWHLHRQNGGNFDQLKFRRFVATALLSQNRKNTVYQKGHIGSSYGADTRYDRLDHLVINQEKQTRCGFCHQKTTTRCSKCDIGVHVKCFISYHTKQ